MIPRRAAGTQVALSTVLTTLPPQTGRDPTNVLETVTVWLPILKDERAARREGRRYTWQEKR